MSSSLYQQVKNTIIHDIRTGKYLAGKRLPNQAQLCERFSASTGTISRAIKELSEEGIVEAKPKLGVVVKRRLNTNEGKIGFLHSRMAPGESPGSTTIFNTFQALFEKSNFDLQYMPFTTTQKGAFPMYRDVGDLYGEPFRALLCIDLMDIEFLSKLKNLSMPVVVLDRNTVDIGLDCVTFNNIQSSFEMTTKFINDGHKNIGFLGGVLPNSPINQHGYDPATSERYQGYVMAHHMAGREIDLNLVRYVQGPDDKGGRYSIKELFSANPELSALLSCEHSDYFEDAIDMAKARHGIKRLDLARWHWGAYEKDELLSRFTYVAHFDLAELTRRAMALITQRLLANVEDAQIKHIILPGSIIE